MNWIKQKLESKGIKDTLYKNGDWVKGGLSELINEVNQYKDYQDKRKTLITISVVFKIF